MMILALRMSYKMGSRIMHYCISSLLADELRIVNKEEFLIGGVAPDVHYYMNIHKDITHFVDRDGVVNKSAVREHPHTETPLLSRL